MFPFCKQQLSALIVIAAISCDQASSGRDKLKASSTALEVDTTLVAPQLLVSWSSRVDTIAGTYTLPVGIAEFWDSVVVIPDMGDRIIWRVNLNTGARTQLGSKGGGPGEYTQVGPAVKIHVDSVALLHGFLGLPFPVISVATGRGRTHSRNVGNSSRSVEYFRALVAAPWLRYADARGNLYGAPIGSATTPPRAQVPTIGRESASDSIPIVRVALQSGYVDTLFQFSTGTVKVPETRAADGAPVVGLDLGPFGTSNDWIPTDDGRIIVADASQYRIQIRDRTANVLAEWRVRRKAVPVTAQRWNAYVKEVIKNSAIYVKQSNDRLTAGMGAALPVAAPNRYVVPSMPAALPLLNFAGGNTHMFFAAGVLWVPVHASEPPAAQQWDLIDTRTRKRLATLSFPERQFLKQVTNLGAYVLAIDDDDLQRLVLYSHPKPTSIPE